MELVSNLTVSDDYDAFARCYAAIKQDETNTEQTRLELRIRYLIVAQYYLKNRSKPPGVIYWNLNPPDGGVSGSDAKSIKDPVLRAQYEKAIAENEALSKAQNKYDLLIAHRYEITKMLSSSITSKNITPEAIAKILYEKSTTPEHARELMSFIDQAAVAENQQPTPWPDAPKK